MYAGNVSEGVSQKPRVWSSRSATLSPSILKKKICSTALLVFLLPALIFKMKAQTRQNGTCVAGGLGDSFCSDSHSPSRDSGKERV